MSTNYRSCILAIFILMPAGTAFVQNPGISIEQLEQDRYRRISDHGFERGVRANTPGSNELEIKITNQWVNRLVGDRSLDPEMRVLSSAVPRFGAPRTLQESGLLGPVAFKTISTQSNE